MMRQSFIAGTSILIASSLITRILGFVYRIALIRLIGAEGVGLFQMVFPILTLMLTVVSAGMGIAISKLVSESLVVGDRRRIRRVLILATGTTLSLAVIFTISLFIFGPALSRHLFTDPRAYFPFITLIPVIGIIAVSSVLRGYFQGLQIMSTPSVASIIETVVRIVGVWVIAALSLAKGLEFAAAGVSAGMILGELAGFLYMYAVYRRKLRVDRLPLPPMSAPTERMRKTVWAMLQIAVPVTFSRLIGSVAFAIEPILVTRSLLAAGIATATATKLYGEYSGMAIPLLVFPTVFTYSLAIQLVPSISAAVAAGQKTTVARRLHQSFRATALIGFPTSLILLQFATPLSQAVFHAAHVGAMLAVMAPVGFLLYLQGPLSGILQGINRAGIAMRNSLIGSGVKLVIIYFLASQPSLGVMGVAWSVTIASSLTTILHINSIHRLIGFYVDTVDVIKILFATIIAGVAMQMLWQVAAPVLPLTLALTSVIGGGLLFYTILLLVIRSITSRSLARIPFLGKPLSYMARLIPFAR